MKKLLCILCALLLCFSAAAAETASTAEPLVYNADGVPVHHVIIDTDAGSDDAAALMMAGSSTVLDIRGITVVYGNVSLTSAAKNAMMVMEICGLDVPVCIGANNPLNKVREQMVSVHGEDGMGDQNLIHPTGKPSEQSAVSFILEQAKAYPDELEIVAIGPLTNIAQAILQDRETMSHVKRVWVMGTSGFGPGNATPVAEFNVYSDPYAYAVLLSTSIPVTIIGLDAMVDGTYLSRAQWEQMLNGNEKGHFSAKAFTKLLAFYEMLSSDMGLPDPLAMAALIWPECVEETIRCSAVACTNEYEPTYGQVIFYRMDKVYESQPKLENGYNVQVVTKINPGLFMEKFLDLMTK